MTKRGVGDVIVTGFLLAAGGYVFLKMINILLPTGDSPVDELEEDLDDATDDEE